MTTLVIAQHNNTQLHPSTLHVVTAAIEIGDDIAVLVAGNNAASVADEAAKINGVAKVLHAEGEHYAEAVSVELADLVVSLTEDYQCILAAATTSGKDLLPRVAALVDASQISDIISVEAADTFKRPIYAGNAIATVQSSDKTKVITVRTTAFDAAAQDGTASIESVASTAVNGSISLIGRAVSERPELSAADIVVSGGRGVGSAENFKIIDNLADKLGAAVGASRAAVDAGYVPNDYQVGQTGKVVAPNLYIAVGISGAIQHLAGMKDSKVIVAINKDEEAPIFQVADYGLVADLFDALPEFSAALSE